LHLAEVVTLQNTQVANMVHPQSTLEAVAAAVMAELATTAVAITMVTVTLPMKVVVVVEMTTAITTVIEIRK
jgi:hypothetical protein